MKKRESSLAFGALPENSSNESCKTTMQILQLLISVDRLVLITDKASHWWKTL
jgi:hypothetical protein